MARRILIAAGVILRRHENEPRAAFGGSLLRRAATDVQNSDDCYVSREHADADRSGYGEAKNQRHEERNHGQPPLFIAVSDAAGPTFVYAASSIYLR
jgi:hypothetical protein